MPLLRLNQFAVTTQRARRGPSLRLPRRELASLRRWVGASSAARLAAATPDAATLLRLGYAERRDHVRQPLATTAELRPISAGGIGLVRAAQVRDVSSEGLALWTAQPLPRGQQVCIEVHPPAGLPRRRFRREEQPIRLLAVVRCCRPEGEGYVLGCGIGIEWADSLANQMFPADLPLRRSA